MFAAFNWLSRFAIAIARSSKRSGNISRIIAADSLTEYYRSGGPITGPVRAADSVTAARGKQITSPINNIVFVVALLTFNNNDMDTETFFAMRFHESFGLTSYVFAQPVAVRAGALALTDNVLTATVPGRLAELALTGAGALKISAPATTQAAGSVRKHRIWRRGWDLNPRSALRRTTP